jgi:hypothetical protein
MIEKIAYDYLSENLDTPVYMEVPEHDAPCEFVVMEKVAGSITDHIRFATIAIQSYSSISLFGAAQLNEDVHEVMDAMADHVDDVSECQMTADTNFTDTSTKRYRYQCLYNIYY